MNAADAFKWVFGIIATIVFTKLLKDWGLLGKTEEEKKVEALYSNPAMIGDATIEAKIKAAIMKKTGKKVVSAADIKALSPTGTTMQAWDTQLKKAAGVFNDNESAVYNVFRNMKNQLSMYHFAKFFSVYNKKSVIDYLGEFMDDEELARVNDIVSRLPLI